MCVRIVRRSKSQLKTVNIKKPDISKDYQNDILYYALYFIKNFNLLNLIEDIYEYKKILQLFKVKNTDELKILIPTLDIDLSFNTLLDKNLKKLSTIIPMDNDEEKILRFLIIYHANKILSYITDLFGDISIYETQKIIATLLNIDEKKVEYIFYHSQLVKASIIDISFGRFNEFDHKIDVFNDDFIEKMLYLDIDIFDMFKEYISKSTKPSLQLSDYNHIKDISRLRKYLSQNHTGINILLYGPPGTGKTELTKTLSYTLNKKLYEISSTNERSYLFERNEENRIKAYNMAQTILDDNSIILYDESEDIFNKDNNRQKNKAWINKSLETNRIPTIWITNNINSIDDAIIRRFDYVLKLPIPPKKYRKKIISKYAEVSDKTLKLLSSHPHLAPAVVERNVKVWKKCSNDEKELIEMINNTLIAQGYYPITKKKKQKKLKYDLPKFYNLEFINTTLNIESLVTNLKSTQRANICIYGVSGTGKSAFGKYIAKQLNKKVILKKGSDLLGMYVGQSEKNIAQAFKQAKKDKAVLIFDEVDTFLQDRNNANRSWEISQVNEMLTQMEEFNGIFIATTNLMDNLDKASLRRFNIKMEFKPLTPTQIEKMFINTAKHLNIKLDTNYLKEIRFLKNLSVGDFSNVIKQHKLTPIISSKELYQRLKNEIDIKNIENVTSIGFIN